MCLLRNKKEIIFYLKECCSQNLHDYLLKFFIYCIFQVNEECSTLRLSLSDAQHECEVAKGEVSVLQVKVQNLETVVKVCY